MLGENLFNLFHILHAKSQTWSFIVLKTKDKAA